MFTTLGVWGLVLLFLLPNVEAKTYRPEVLRETLARAKEIYESGQRPVVVFDLDDTLFESRPRTLRILREFAEEEKARFPELREKISRLKKEDIRYVLSETLGELGIQDSELIAAAAEFWKQRFFGSEYCAADPALPGAVKYVNEAHSLATVVYLTGRDGKMQACTLEAIRRQGLPFGDGRSVLMMKSDTALDDLSFKKNAVPQIQTLGRVVGFFENEPVNLNWLSYLFGMEVSAVFVDTIHSPKPDQPNPSIPWVRDFFY